MQLREKLCEGLPMAQGVLGRELLIGIADNA
jgi:hypothetical protein